MKEFFENGWEASKEFAKKAGAKAQDLSERGLLMWDIKQLENQAKKLFASLGNVIFIAFIDHDKTTIKRDSEEIKIILNELINIKEQIESKENDLRNRG
jgi:hypothetical protein